MRKNLSNLSSWAVFFYDLVLVLASWLLAYYVRFNFEHTAWHGAFDLIPWVLLVNAVVFKFYGIDRQVWRFTSILEVFSMVKSIIIATLVLAALLFLLQKLNHVPRSIFVLYPIFLLILMVGSRAFVRYWRIRGRILRGQSEQKRTLIIGGGRGADLFLRDIDHLRTKPYQCVGILDDSKSLKGRKIRGVKIVGLLKELKSTINRFHIELIVIAIPSLSAKKMQELVTECKDLSVELKVLPSLSDLNSGRVSASEIKEVSLADLLGRDPVQLDHQLMKSFLDHKVVMVTGGGGSIGSELCRQILNLSMPQQLIVVDHSEFNLYQIEQQLQGSHRSLDFRLASIANEKIMVELMQRYQPQVIFHAAAYKHVPLLEYQPEQAVLNNVHGTQVIAKLADQFSVEKFVLVSTDKAVNPANIMGASKRIAEVYCQNLNEQSTTQYVTVRFGNVLGSAGSVVPLFKQQLKKGGPLTLTHPDIERFFMTIPEACQLILQAGSMGQGGEIFVLDMGEPVKIKYLAEQLITLSGKKPYEEVDIQYVGLRPGEKLYEELFYAKEPLTKTEQAKILIANKKQVDFVAFDQELQMLFSVVGDAALRQKIKQLVPEFIG